MCWTQNAPKTNEGREYIDSPDCKRSVGDCLLLKTAPTTTTEIEKTVIEFLRPKLASHRPLALPSVIWSPSLYRAVSVTYFFKIISSWCSYKTSSSQQNQWFFINLLFIYLILVPFLYCQNEITTLPDSIHFLTSHHIEALFHKSHHLLHNMFTST